ncbi:MAG TPA: PHP domain-containing protein, partial [Pirellulales bacterium]
MPDPPLAKRRVEVAPAAPIGAWARPGYAELHCKTNFSFLEGASHPDELVAQAAALGYRALAVTDRHSLAGVVRAHAAAKQSGLKLLIGAEVWPTDSAGAVLLATDRAAYGRLARLLTVGRRRAAKGECLLTFEDIAEHAEGLLALVLPDKFTSRSISHGSTLTRSASEEQHARLACASGWCAGLPDYRDVFGDRAYTIAEIHHGPDDRKSLARRLEQARRARLPVVAANDVRYHVPERRALEDVLTAVRAGCTVTEAGELLFANAER